MVLYNLTLAAAVLSLLTSFLIMYFYFKYSRYTDSRLLNTIISLIFTDFMVSFLVIVWDIINRVSPSEHMDHILCSIFLPFPIYFFIAGYGWTIIIAGRFLAVSLGKSAELTSPTLTSTSTSEKQRINSSPRLIDRLLNVGSWSQSKIHHVVWGGSLLCVSPLIIFNLIGGEYNISDVVNTPVSPDGSYCVFDSNSYIPIVTNNLCFQLPLLITIAANTRAFYLGLRALRNSPHSVIAREMNRVGKYLFVLLIVWIPNFLANLYQQIYPRNSTRFDVLIEVMVLLTSFQGFLNSAVYCWGHKSFRKYISARFKPFIPQSSSISSSISYSEYPSPLLPHIPSSDHDLNDVVDAVEHSYDHSTSRTASDLEARGGGGGNKGKQLDSGERILRFSPTISVKYFDKDKFHPSQDRKVTSALPMRSRPIPSQLQTHLMSEDHSNVNNVGLNDKTTAAVAVAVASPSPNNHNSTNNPLIMNQVEEGVAPPIQQTTELNERRNGEEANEGGEGNERGSSYSGEENNDGEETQENVEFDD